MLPPSCHVVFTALRFLYNPSLPFEEEIVAHCVELGLPRGTPIVDPSTNSVIAWIKCGLNVTIDEAMLSVRLVSQTYKPLAYSMRLWQNTTGAQLDTLQWSTSMV